MILKCYWRFFRPAFFFAVFLRAVFLATGRALTAFFFARRAAGRAAFFFAVFLLFVARFFGAGTSAIIIGSAGIAG